MTEPAGELLRRNPFAPSAVERVLGRFLDEAADARAPVSIKTDPIEQALRHLAGYLRPASGELGVDAPSGGAPATGTVLAVVGDYGTGKTHLAMRLLRQASRVHREGALVVHPFYLMPSGNLEVSVGAFEKLYRDFVDKLDRTDLLETVRDYYADVVARALETADFTRETARRLRDRELDPDSVVRGLGLIDSLLARELRQDLIDVTEKEEFGTALAMLLRRPEFADDIWSWLTGDEPKPALVERGIARAIAGEDMALEAMGVFAHLYGRRNHRFVLVIDELDKLSSVTVWSEREQAKFLKLFQVLLAARAFLVVVGLPDLFEMLGTWVSERISHTITIPPLSGDDVRRLIAATLPDEAGTPLGPFVPAVADLIAKLANGTVRQVVRLCHRSYQLMIEEGAEQISEDLVRRAARSAEDEPTLRTVKRRLRRQLTSFGHSFQSDYWLPEETRPVDFWVTVGTQRSGCAVILTPSVVTEEHAQPLITQAVSIRTRLESAETLLILVGYLNQDLREHLTDVYSAGLLEYGQYEFDEDLRVSINDALRRIEQSEGEDIEARLLERLTWMNRQQAYAHESIENLSRRVDELRRSLSTWAAPLSGPEAEGSSRLPPLVTAAFDDAFGVLDEFSITEPALAGALSVGESAARAEHERTLRRWLGSTELYPATGVLSLLRQLVEAFRSGIIDWFALREAAGSRQEAAESLNRVLAIVCESYEAIYYYLPLPRLDDYLRVQALGRVHDAAESDMWAARRQAVPRTLDDLGRRVRHAALRELGEAQRDAGI